jgi:hypothetical protein
MFRLTRTLSENSVGTRENYSKTQLWLANSSSSTTWALRATLAFEIRAAASFFLESHVRHWDRSKERSSKSMQKAPSELKTLNGLVFAAEGLIGQTSII